VTVATRVGIILPTRGLVLSGSLPNVEPLTRLARRAEELGLDGVWAGDSLTAKPRLEPLSVLAAVAGVTGRVRLGTAVLLAALRQPVLLAQQAATVDLLSDGRLTLGIGVGGSFNAEQRAEWAAAGVGESGHGRRLREVVEITQALWSGEPLTCAGEHFQLSDVRLGFRPAQTPRIRTLLACHSGESRRTQYRRAARLADGMISITDSPAEFARVREQVLSEVRSLGRDAAAFGATFYMTVNLNRDVEAAQKEADAWVRAYYGVNYWGERWGPYGAPEAVLERARAYADAGADELVFRFASYDQAAQLELFAREVLPKLR